MPRIRSNVKNMWGKAEGADPQRADLWQVDLTSVVNGVSKALNRTVPTIPTYFAASVNLPDLKVKAEPIMRDSRPYMMPSWDEPLDAVEIMFHMDDAGLTNTPESVVPQSLIYKTLDMWRRLVRAGRGPLGSEREFRPLFNYTFEYAFPISLYLLKGYGLPPKSFTQSTKVTGGSSTAGFQAVNLGGDYNAMVTDTNNEAEVTQRQITEVVADAGQLFTTQMANGLYISGILQLEYAWLSAFKVEQLTYNGSNILGIRAVLYCENVLQNTTDPLADAAATP